MRVGRINKVWHHETAERLFCEEVDVGDGELRPIASGLRPFYRAEDLAGRLVVVVCNLKEAKMQGFMSTGMVLAAKSADGQTVELVDPHPDSRPGDRVSVDGLSGSPWSAAKVCVCFIYRCIEFVSKHSTFDSIRLKNQRFGRK